MGVVGSFKAARSLAASLHELSEDKTRRALNKRLGHEALTQLNQGFIAGRDPYGKKWLKPEYRMGGSPLRDKGRLQRSFSVQGVSADGFRLGTNAIYAGTHQYGAVIRPKTAKALAFWVPGSYQISSYSTGRRLKQPKISSYNLVLAGKVEIPQRQMVPEGDLGVWAQPMDEVVDRFVAEVFSRNSERGAG